MDYYTAHIAFNIMVVVGIVEVIAFLVCVVRVIIFDINSRRWWRRIRRIRHLICTAEYL
jgi:hypothetical protein